MKKILIAVSLAGLAGASLAAPVVQNGSFEEYSVDYDDSAKLNTLQGSYPFFGTWSANGTNTRIVDAGPSLLPPGNGTQYALFTSAAQSIYQGIGGFTTGQAYQVSFWATGGVGNWAVNQSGYGSSQGSFAATSAWQKYSFTFTATNAYQHLWFTGGGSSAVSVDNISVSAVPEPETYAMMLLGLGVVGAVARRRKSA